MLRQGGRPQREHLGDPGRKRSKVEEGAGKSTDRLPLVDAGDHANGIRRRVPVAPEDHANTTRS
jgi:hypothetical protein